MFSVLLHSDERVKQESGCGVALLQECVIAGKLEDCSSSL